MIFLNSSGNVLIHSIVNILIQILIVNWFLSDIILRVEIIFWKYLVFHFDNFHKKLRQFFDLKWRIMFHSQYSDSLIWHYGGVTIHWSGGRYFIRYQSFDQTNPDVKEIVVFLNRSKVSTRKKKNMKHIYGFKMRTVFREVPAAGTLAKRRGDVVRDAVVQAVGVHLSNVSGGLGVERVGDGGRRGQGGELLGRAERPRPREPLRAPRPVRRHRLLDVFPELAVEQALQHRFTILWKTKNAMWIWQEENKTSFKTLTKILIY